MKAPPKRKGNYIYNVDSLDELQASMKAPPKRKGNGVLLFVKSTY